MYQRLKLWNIKPLFLIFKLIKCLGMLPLEIKLKKNEFKCSISKPWIYLTCFYALMVVLYTVLTIYSALHIFYKNNEQSIADFVQLIVALMEILQLNMNYVYSMFYLKKIAKLLDIIFEYHLNSDVKNITKQLATFIIIVLVVYFVFTMRIVLMFWLFEPSYATKIKVMSWKQFNDCKIGITLRAILILFREAPIILMSTICLLISNIFQDIADSLKIHLNFKIVLNKGKIANNRFENKINYIDTKYLAEKNIKFRLAIKCVKKINQYYGIPLLIMLSTDLFSMIFFIFRQFSDHGIKIPAARNILGAFSQLCQFIIIIWIGSVLKTKSQKPIQALQKADIVYLPSNLQVQIQTLFFQWSTTGPGYISPFNIMKIETPLLASIITNFLTYLMILIQYDH